LKTFFIILGWLFSASAFGAEIPRVDISGAAFAVGSVDNDDPRVEVRLVTDKASAEPGETVSVGVLFHIDPEWHVYWRNSGESGMATDVSLNLPAWNTSPLRWPAPTVFVDKSGQVATFGYSDAEIIWFDVVIPPGMGETALFEVEANWLSCKVECIPGSATLTTRIRRGPSTDSESTAIFEAARTRIPKTPAEAGVDVAFVSSITTIHRAESFDATLKVAAPVLPAAAERFTFIPDEAPGIAWKVTTSNLGAESAMHLQGIAKADAFKGRCGLSGVIWTAQGALALDFPLDCTNDMPAVAADPRAANSTDDILPSDKSENTPLAYFLLLAFLGGILLNLMPCVFPILALKSFSLIQNANAGRRHALAHAGAYAAGVVGTMLVLAALVVLLRGAGTQVGWGFQFQEPWFLVGLVSLLTLFAANLFGVFEITFSASFNPDQSPGLKRSFSEGAIAVVLATPCSAPMLGTAVGFALSSSAAVIFGVFALLGVGLSLPFVLLSAFPSWAKVLPRPGAWMETFKKFLGFTLLGAAIWILWLIGQVLGADASSRVLAFVTALVLGAWVFGLNQFASSKKKWIGFAIWISIASAGSMLLPEMVPQKAEIQDDLWKPWSKERVQTELAKGNSVFVDFTADWCITCKVNENGVLASDTILERLREPGLVALKADWTLRDEDIRLELQKYGKAGVPMYLVFHPREPRGRLLPELLTQSIILESLEK
jgi:thiol:disulfide interchange protein/DsbC/DsbD-like thiol-disulfide interchange protein